MSASPRAGRTCASTTAAVRKACGSAKTEDASPRTTADPCWWRGMAACADARMARANRGRHLPAGERLQKERCQLETASAGLQAVVRKARARALTANASAPGKALLINGICCTREIFAANRCGCPEGTTPSENGSCQPAAVFTAPLCVGPNCPTPPGGACPDGRPRNSDGNCPPPQICTGGKIFDGNTCRCEAGKIENESGQMRAGVNAAVEEAEKEKEAAAEVAGDSDGAIGTEHQHRHRHWRRRTRQPVTPVGRPPGGGGRGGTPNE